MYLNQYYGAKLYPKIAIMVTTRRLQVKWPKLRSPVDRVRVWARPKEPHALAWGLTKLHTKMFRWSAIDWKWKKKLSIPYQVCTCPFSAYSPTCCVSFISFRPMYIWKSWHMMTSSNGNIFRVTGPSCGEFTGPGEFLHKGQWRGALMFSLICIWINGWVNNHEAGDLRRHRGHFDVNVMIFVPRWRMLPGLLCFGHVDWIAIC